MERRACTRSPVTVDVFVPIEGRNHQVCKVIDMSSRGVYLAADSRIFPIDAPVALFFAVKKHKGSVIQLHRMTGKVVRFDIRGVALAFCRQAKSTQQIRRKNPATVSVMRP
jgi:PilZ domain